MKLVVGKSRNKTEADKCEDADLKEEQNDDAIAIFVKTLNKEEQKYDAIANWCKDAK